MPIYEYKCRENGHVFEVIQKFSDEPLSVCKYCKSPVDKLVSASAFHLKGQGWYVTDYGKGSGTKPEKPKSGDSGASKPKDAKTSAKSPGKDSGASSKKEP